jgi:hypothetical protein
MDNWLKQLRFDPLFSLLNTTNEALRYFARRDLCGESPAAIEDVWHLPVVERLLNRQRADGAWKYRGGKARVRSAEDYHQLETFRNVGLLVEKYGLDQRHPALQKAADYLFSRQTPEADFRGIYGSQYTPNYSAAIIELLIKAGYADDARIERGFRWLLSIRQRDGGWTIPLRTVGRKFDPTTLNAPPIQPDPSKPFSHLVTGVVLRAFAAHPVYDAASEARTAGNLLRARFFQPDKYVDRRAASFWTAFSYPFWFTDLLSALDSLSLLGFSAADAPIAKALDWFVVRQQNDGVWRLPLLRSGKDKDGALWVSLAICRVFQRFFGG